MGKVIKRYCPNGECHSQRRNRKGGGIRGRYIGESDENVYSRHCCPECKEWYAWDGEKLVECGTMVLEDTL